MNKEKVNEGKACKINTQDESSHEEIEDQVRNNFKKTWFHDVVQKTKFKKKLK